MKFLNTATHPGTLFSKIRRGSREDGLSSCDEVDEYVLSVGAVALTLADHTQIDLARASVTSANSTWYASRRDEEP